MIEYAGYIPGKSIDWLSLAKGVKTDIDQGLKVREEKKAEDQKLVTDVTTRLKQWESTQNKAFNEVVFGGLDKARNQALEWNRQLRNGEISRSEYQMRMNNMNDSFDAFSVATKNFDNYVVGVNKAQQDGEMSAFGMYGANINTRLMDIGTKEMQIGENGDFFVTGQDGSIQNVRNYTNMNNVIDKKVDVAKSVDAVVSKWDPVVLQELKQRGATVLTEDPRLNAAYNKTKADLIGALVDRNNPRGVTSILLDNSNLDYNLYYTADDARNIISKAVANEEMALGRNMTDEERSKFSEKYFNENMIQVVQDNDGNYQPKLTDKMFKDAEMVVGNQIEQQLGFKKEEERGFAPSGGNRYGGGDEEEEVNYTLYEKSLNAFNLPFAEKSGTPEREQAKKMSAQRLTSLSGGRYTFQWGTGSDKGFLIATEKGKKTPKVIKAKKYDEIVPILFGESGATGSDKAYEEYRKQREAYFNAGGQSAGGTKPKTTSTKYNIKGKTYTLEQLQGMGYTEDQVESYKVK